MNRDQDVYWFEGDTDIETGTDIKRVGYGYGEDTDI